VSAIDAQGQHLPRYIQQEFDDFLQCGRLEYGFLRIRGEDCQHERLGAFSCKRRGFCPSCGAQRMAESAALLVEEVLPIRQWVLSFPFQLRFLLARHPEMMGKVLSIVYRTLATHLINIVESIISMARSLNLEVVAEGVETREQVEFLKKIRCQEAQGYYFSKPLPPEQFSEKLRENQKNTSVSS
jgi:hypothetical protein